MVSLNSVNRLPRHDPIRIVAAHTLKHWHTTMGQIRVKGKRVLKYVMPNCLEWWW